MNVWEPRLGTAAALSYWGWIRWTIWGRFAVLGFMLLFALGAYFHSALVEVLSYSIFIFIIVSVVGIQPPAKKRFMTVASSTLGVEITKQNFPPKSDARYKEWCTNSGIDPNRL